MSQPTVRIYHNPRCSKSREALSLLRERNIEPEIVLYLERGVARSELHELCQGLGARAHDLLRTKEAAYGEAGLSEASAETDIFDAIVNTPILLERPIVVVRDRAVIARPPALLLELIEPT